MAGSDGPAVQLPVPRPNVLDIAPQYHALRSEAPLTRVVTTTGQPAWLVTAYKKAREIFADSARFGFCPHPDPEPTGSNATGPAMAGLLDDYQNNITRLRKLMVPWFAPKRLRAWTGRIQQLTDECLDELAAARPKSQPAGELPRLSGISAAGAGDLCAARCTRRGSRLRHRAVRSHGQHRRRPRRDGGDR